MRKEKIVYYKRTQRRHHGKLIVVSILKVDSDGNIYCVDLTRMKTSTMKTFGGVPMALESATKKQYDNAVKQIQNHYK